MSKVVTCACGKKSRVPEGITARAIRCPHCQGVIRLTPPSSPPAAATTTTPKAAPPAPKAPPVPAKAPPPKAVATAPVAAPKSLPAAAKPPAGRVIQDPPNVWLYVTDPALIAKVEAEGDGRHTSLTTYGPGDDPLAGLKVKDEDELRAYLGKNEYIAWVGRPSDKTTPGKEWIAWVLGGIFVLVGLSVVAVGLLAAFPFIALNIVLVVFGLIFAAAGGAVIYLMSRGSGVVSGTEAAAKGVYLITNRRVIVWVNKQTVRSFTGPMVMNMHRTMEDEDEDRGSLMFTHGLDNMTLAGFLNVDKVSEVEELVRGYLIDRVLEKSAAGDGPRLVPMEGPNPFKKDDGKGERKGPPKKIELWQAAALAAELEKPLTPEMIKAAKEHTESVLKESRLQKSETDTVRDELKPGESIVWVGRPDPSQMYRRAWFVTFILLGGIVFSAGILVTVALTGAIPGGGFDIGLIVTGVALALGALAALGFPFYKKWLAGRTFYVLTSRRALVWAAEWHGGPKLEAYGPRDLSNLHVKDKDVVFRTMTTIYRNKQGTSTSTQRFGFLAQDDPVMVERLIRETLVEPFLEKAYE